MRSPSGRTKVISARPLARSGRVTSRCFRRRCQMMSPLRPCSRPYAHVPTSTLTCRASPSHPGPFVVLAAQSTSAWRSTLRPRRLQSPRIKERSRDHEAITEIRSGSGSGSEQVRLGCLSLTLCGQIHHLHLIGLIGGGS